ncbi:hypothetical protein FH603_2853 [Spirosoma sp. LMG 31447]|uniref:Uncharacterized protein n=1 Tax=Spirosoma utsteinense TaxID=2585773 RepID=A0ABR6W8Q0_9BACT|nr:hypothetical protein [Spirosoma utsteinense]
MDNEKWMKIAIRKAEQRGTEEEENEDLRRVLSEENHGPVAL